MKKRFVSILIFSLFFITSCNGQGTSPGYQTSSTTRPATHSIITSTVTLTEIPISADGRLTQSAGPSPVDTPVSVLTPETDPGVVQNCLEIQPTLPGHHAYSGTIAFETHGPQVKNTLSFYNFDRGDFTEIAGSHNDNLSISPDRMRFAYEDFDTKQLEVISADGERIKSLGWMEDWGNIAGWLNDQSIVIVTSVQEAPNSSYVKYPRRVVIVKPDSNSTQTMPTEFPDIDRASPTTSWGRSGTLVFDPTLTRVVYPGSMKLEDYDGMGYILYSLSENMKLAQLPSQSWNKLPVWSPDGSQFIVMGDDEFYLVTRDGEITRVTHLNPGFHPPGNTKINYFADYYSWSPDSQHVAFWLKRSSSDSQTLAILDTHTGLVVDTCISAGFNPSDIRTLPYPVWSPDGKSLVVAANYQPAEDSYYAVVVDLNEHTVYKIAENIFPVGWLKAP
jgi:hypothetical protein